MKFVLCKCFCLLLLFAAVTDCFSQEVLRSIRGVVSDKRLREPVEFVNVIVEGTTLGAMTDSLGRFEIKNVHPGIYKLKASSIGYTTVVTPDYIVSNHDIEVEIEIEENRTELEGVVVTGNVMRKSVESPLSLRRIGLQEIEKSPGGNRDISRIVRAYPGVAFSPAGYRNDLIVRGGSPSENRFFLDGVEIPNINHFSTQGASGGPCGIINADFIREVDFYTGAFPVNRGNALSSVLDFKLRDGEMDRNTLKATLGASEVSLAASGHIKDRTSYIVSVRQSYLQMLFRVLGLPFLPKFTDAQFKVKTRFDVRNELTVLGITGFDDMSLNEDGDDEYSEYLLSYLPKIKQETYTVGAVYRHYAGAHVQTVVLSNNYLNNRNLKYVDNDDSSPDNLTLRLRSVEQEVKFRAENSSDYGAWKTNYGVNVDFSHYKYDGFQKIYASGAHVYDYTTSLGMLRWGLFARGTYVSPGERVTVTAGFRTDANNFSRTMSNPLKQFSPRASLSVRMFGDVYLNAESGLYYQLPPYTALGFKGEGDTYLNKNLKYMKGAQYSFGFSWNKANEIELSLEGFYKKYGNVPLSVVDGIPLLCKGNDYGVIGNELLVSSAASRSYGMEVLFRWIVARKLNLLSSFTLFKSECNDGNGGRYIPSAWDNRFILNVSGTYNFPHNWSLGAKVSCIGGGPYTPYDADKSSLVQAWNAQGRPYYDYTRYNSERLPAFAQLDIRVDKTFYMKKYTLGFYIDLQNVTNAKFRQQDILMSTGVVEDPSLPVEQQRYVMKHIKQESGTILPTIGITFEY